MYRNNIYRLVFSLGVLLSLAGCGRSGKYIVSKIKLVADAGRTYQTVEGFGVNINPGQWNEGNLKQAIDLLVDDLGSVQFRFDCTGLANWLDPARRNKDGKYPDEYLSQIYSNKTFRDAWACFRYLNSKGIEPFFNVSGRIPEGLGKAGKPDQLADFNGYAEMVVSMLKWARHNENLRFSLLAPFNETDLSYPEGPGIDQEDAVPAIKAIINKLKEYGMSDIRLVVMDDNAVRPGKMKNILNDTSILSFVSKIGVHTYGMGHEQYTGWFTSETDYSRLTEMVKESPYRNCSLWMTEYGDLDQTGLAEFNFSWTITKRLLKMLKDGYSAAMFWDAFDNFHKHDTVWSRYGLLETDTINGRYTPRLRYYASKEVYRYVRPGFRQVEIKNAAAHTSFDIYERFHDTLTYVPVLAFVSADRQDFTIVGMNGIESDTELSIQLEGLDPAAYEKKVNYFRTGDNEKCNKVSVIIGKNNSIRAIIKPKSIFTLTTLP